MPEIINKDNKVEMNQTAPSMCPYQNAMATSPQMALPAPQQSSTATRQTTQGWRNFFRMRDQGPHVFFAKMAARTAKPFIKVQVGPKSVYQVTDSKIAQELLTKHAKQLGRGDLLVPFGYMVGDVFFKNDGEKAAETRKVFLNTVTRLPENFTRIAQVNARTFDSIQLTGGCIPDLFVFVAWHIMGCISACFVGTDDLSSIPSDTHITFMKATRQIALASMDPVSRLIHPCLRPGFYAASNAMAHIATQLLHNNSGNICKGNNYIWDLAIYRAKELHPEMNFDNCTHFVANNQQAQIVRELILHDRFVREHGPLTIFASSNLGATLFYMLDILGRRPDVMIKMRDEVDRVVGNQPFTYEQITLLPYTRAVVQEALWQSTPIPDFPREVLSDFKADISGENISFQRGDMLMLVFRPMQGVPREFTPEQWLVHPAPTQYAFSIGHRRCPARPFAEEVLTQFLIEMISRDLHIVLTNRATYTTRNGLLGPDYQPQQPVKAEVHSIPVAVSRL
jgi:cytochrome P450